MPHSPICRSGCEEHGFIIAVSCGALFMESEQLRSRSTVPGLDVETDQPLVNVRLTTVPEPVTVPAPVALICILSAADPRWGRDAAFAALGLHCCGAGGSHQQSVNLFWDGGEAEFCGLDEP